MQGRALEAPRLALGAVLALLAAFAGACASSNTAGTASTGPLRPRTPASMGTPAAETPVAEAASPPAPRASSTSRSVVDTAMSLRGVPYRPGGSDPKGFDCSGFTMYVFGRHGVGLPRSTGDQFRKGKSIKAPDIVAGDLLFFKTTGRDVAHVAISIGGQRFVHAPSSTGVVRVESLESTYWSPRFLGARRVT